jgi:uncharacterized protein
MPRPVHFEIPADKPQRAIKFYRGVFGWKISKWGGPMSYWLATTGKPGEMGIDGAITLRSSLASTTNTIGVENLEEAMAKVEAAGGKLTTPKMAVPGVGWMCYCLDTEGNMFGLMQPDMTAK